MVPLLAAVPRVRTKMMTKIWRDRDRARDFSVYCAAGMIPMTELHMYYLIYIVVTDDNFMVVYSIVQ